QATGDPTSLGLTSEGGANPHFSGAKSKAGANSGLSASKDSISQTIMNGKKKMKKFMLPNILKLKTLQLPYLHLQDEAKVALLSAQPSFPNVAQLIELLVFASASQKSGDTSVPSAAKLALNLLREIKTQIKSPSLSYFKEKLQRILKRPT
nr:hypothetical protein [Tanacetum cinerariifolium]